MTPFRDGAHIIANCVATALKKQTRKSTGLLVRYCFTARFLASRSCCISHAVRNEKGTGTSSAGIFGMPFCWQYRNTFPSSNWSLLSSINSFSRIYPSPRIGGVRNASP